MKYTITHTAEWILLAIITLLLIFTAWKSYQLKGKIETITVTDTLTIQDTITNWSYDTLYFNRYDTIKLPVVDTINDTIIKIDSILVQIPINTYVYDTTITDSLYRTSLRAVTSGFAVTMDSLYLNTEIMPQKVKKQPWYGNIVPAVGVGFGTGGFGVFAGVGYKLF
jgi:hypothetical protein